MCFFPSYAPRVLVPLLTGYSRNIQAKTQVIPSFSIPYLLPPSSCCLDSGVPPASLLGHVLVSCSILTALPSSILTLSQASPCTCHQWAWESIMSISILLCQNFTSPWAHLNVCDAGEGNKPAEEGMPFKTWHLPSVFLSVPAILILFNLGNGYLY